MLQRNMGLVQKPQDLQVRWLPMRQVLIQDIIILQDSLKIIPITARRSAPNAMRIPISFVRRATV